MDFIFWAILVLVVAVVVSVLIHRHLTDKEEKRVKETFREMEMMKNRWAENERKFKEVMSGLGFNDPLADFLRLTKENRVQWGKTFEEVDSVRGSVIFTAKNIVDGISIELETLRVDNNLLWHELDFCDGQNRFKRMFFLAMSDFKKVSKENELLKEYFQWLSEKFQVNLIRQPQ